MLPESWSPIKKIGKAINYGVEISTIYDGEEKLRYMEDFENYINEAVNQLSKEEIENVLALLTKTKESYTTIIHGFANIGLGMKKTVQTVDGEIREAYIDAKSQEDNTDEERLASSILSFNETSNSIMILYYAIEVIDISIGLISKYLPSQKESSQDGKKLKRNTKECQ